MLVIDDLSLRIAGRLLIDDASAQIPTGARVGLVGRNGTGKTTLFRAIAGELALEQGSIGVPKRSRIGRLSQEAPDGPQSLIDIVLAADPSAPRCSPRPSTSRTRTGSPRFTPGSPTSARMRRPGRAAAILAGLGFSGRRAGSGRAPRFPAAGACASRSRRLLFSEPDLLLLDEPTNYLDLEGTLWLQDYLARYPHTVVLISHDRDLLDSAVGHILHLERGKLTLYTRQLFVASRASAASGRRSISSAPSSRTRSASASRRS